MRGKRGVDFSMTPLPKKDLFLEEKIFLRESHVDIVSLVRQHPEVESKIIDFFVNKLIDDNKDYFWQRYDLSGEHKEYVSVLERKREPQSGLDKLKLWLLKSVLLGNRKARENLDQLLDLGIPVWNIFELFHTNRRSFKELLSDNSFRTGLIYLEQLGVRFYYGAYNPELVKAIIELGKVDEEKVQKMVSLLKSSFTFKNVIFAASVNVYGGHNSGSYSLSAGRLNSIIELLKTDYLTDELMESCSLQDKIIILGKMNRGSLILKNSRNELMATDIIYHHDTCLELSQCLEKLPDSNDLIPLVELLETYVFYANDSIVINKLFNGQIDASEVFGLNSGQRFKSLRVKDLLVALDRVGELHKEADNVVLDEQKESTGDAAIWLHQDIDQVLLNNLKVIAQRGWEVNDFVALAGKDDLMLTREQLIGLVDKVQRLANIAQDEDLSNWVFKIFSSYRKDLPGVWNIDVIESFIKHKKLIDDYLQIYDYLFSILSSHVTAVDGLAEILNFMEAKMIRFFQTEYGFSRGRVFSFLTSLLEEIDSIDEDQLLSIFAIDRSSLLLPILLKEFSKRSSILRLNPDILEEDLHTLVFISDNLSQQEDLLDPSGNPTIKLIEFLASSSAGSIIKSKENIILKLFDDVINMKYSDIMNSSQVIELVNTLSDLFGEESDRDVLSSFVLSSSNLIFDLFKLVNHYNGSIPLKEFYLQFLKNHADIIITYLASYSWAVRVLFSSTFSARNQNTNPELENQLVQAWSALDSLSQRELVSYLLKEGHDSLEMFMNRVVLIGKIDVLGLPELSKIKFQLVPMLLESDNPITLLNQIVDVFQRNNLPLFAKKLKIFEILYFAKGANGEIKFNSILDKKRGFLSPTFELGSKRRVLYTAYRDLLRVSIESDDFNLRAYLLSIQENEGLLEKLDSVGLNGLSDSERAKLELFVDRLLVLYNNSLMGKSREETFLETTSLEEKLVFLRNGLDLKADQKIIDRLAEMFLKPLGFSSINEVISRMDQVQLSANERNRSTPNVERGVLQLSEGDLLKATEVNALFPILHNGIIARDFLGVNADYDATPFDADFSRVQADDIGEGVRSIIEVSPSGGGRYGNVILVVRDRGQFNISREQKYANVDRSVLKYIKNKYELFISDVINKGSGRHWGIRVGVPSTQIDALVVRHEAMSTEDVDRVIDAVLTSGFYIPVFDHDGNIIFSPEDYDRAKATKQPIPVLDFEKIEDKQGSNEGGTYLINGEKFYVKHGPKDEGVYSEAVARVWNEWLATKFYEAFGLNVPESSIVSLIGESEISYATKYLNGKKKTGKVAYQHESFLNGWIMDCYLANWDVLLNNNVEMYDGVSYRLDNGGALLFRARGRRKGMDQTQNFGPEVLELDSMRRPDGLTEEEVVIQAKKLIEIFTDAVIDSLVDSSGLPHKDKVYLKKVLKLRRDYIAERYNIENPYAYGADANEADLLMKLINFINQPNISGKDLLTYLYDLYPELYGSIVWNNESLEKHTLRVLDLFEKYGMEDQLPEFIDVNKFKLILAIHDIGKPQALFEGNRKLQHKYNPVYIKQLFEKLGKSENEFYMQLAITLTSTDIIGSYIRGKVELDDAAARVKELAKSLDMEPLDFFNLLCVYYKVDAGSYSQVAGLSQKSFGDELVILDDNGRQLLFNSSVQSKLGLIEQELKLNK